MAPKHQRLIFLAAAAIVVAVAAFFFLRVFNDNLVFFYSPTDVIEKHAEDGTRMRIGGLVQPGSVHITGNGLKVSFVLTDYAHNLEVQYVGVLPNLFREGQGVVAEGELEQKGTIFKATRILAKHDENYMPKDVADTLKNKGRWRPNAEADSAP